MKAILVSSFGAPEVLRLTELPDPTPGPGEVAIDVARTSLATLIAAGQFFALQAPGAHRQAVCLLQAGVHRGLPGSDDRPGRRAARRRRVSQRRPEAPRPAGEAPCLPAPW